MIAHPAIFDVRVPLRRRNKSQLVIAPLLAFCAIGLGVTLLPDGADFRLRLESIPTWNGWGFAAMALMGTGLVLLIKTALFAYRSWGGTGEWHFRLDHNYLTWDVPVHGHGEETGFRTPLSEIKEIEERFICIFDEPNETQFWVHFKNKPSVQLQSYSGLSLPWLVSEICNLGVPSTTTTVEE